MADDIRSWLEGLVWPERGRAKRDRNDTRSIDVDPAAKR